MQLFYKLFASVRKKLLSVENISLNYTLQGQEVK